MFVPRIVWDDKQDEDTLVQSYFFAMSLSKHIHVYMDTRRMSPGSQAAHGENSLNIQKTCLDFFTLTRRKAA